MLSHDNFFFKETNFSSKFEGLEKDSGNRKGVSLIVGFSMGRVKLKIKRLESTSNRQVTYSKRRNGILKKAKELSILCDIDIVLLMFSPTGRPTLFHGEHSNIEDVIAKFSQLTPQERAKRKLESLEALKKTFKKLDHDVDIEDFLGASTQDFEGLTDELRLVQARIAGVHRRLSYWRNPDKIDSVEHLRQMEELLRESIHRIRLHKENFGKCQILPLECISQLQSGMPLPLMMTGMQEAQPLSWLPNNNQHQIVSNEPNILPNRDIDCSTDCSFTGYSGYFRCGKQKEIGNSGSIDNRGQEGCPLSDLSSGACLSLELGEQFSYPPYGCLNLPEMEMSLQGNHPVYQFNSSFELPRPIYDNENHAWFSASGPCGMAMIDKKFHTNKRIDSCESGQCRFSLDRRSNL